jgi:hypothetical protein
MLARMTVVCLLGACSLEAPSERLDNREVKDGLCDGDCSPDVEAVFSAGRAWEQLYDKVFVSTDDGKIFDDPCAQLPAEGICAFACSPDELQKHIPAGSCIDIRCELRDGREILAGGCAAP